MVMWIICGYSQENAEATLLSDQYIYEGNTIVEESFVEAEKNYRMALSEMPSNRKGAYNLGNAYYTAELYDEALARLNSVAKDGSKSEKYRAYHNIGNTLMQNKQCEKAVEAFKNALRNNPSDDESRYNLALAQQCAKEEGGGGDGKDDKEDKDQKEDKNNEDKKDSDKKQDEEDKNKDKGDGDKESKDGANEQKEDENPKDKKGGKKDGGNKKPQQQPGKLSGQQIKSLLDAMNNEEKKVQEKMNVVKEKGAKIQTEKDW
jgi:tetratricopeptide (TPR) repeat protein